MTLKTQTIKFQARMEFTHRDIIYFIKKSVSFYRAMVSHIQLIFV